MSRTIIIGGCRTPMGRFLGGLSSESAIRLGSVAIRDLLIRTQQIPGEIDQVLMGQVVSAGAGQAPARQAAIGGGLPPSVGAASINKVCGSGLYAVMLADMAIRSGDMQQVVAGGMESMSHGPHLIRGGRSGWKYGSRELVDAVEYDGLYCSLGQTGMGAYADATAKLHTISRVDQDAWSLTSHQRASAATSSGDFAKEIVPVAVVSRKETTTVSEDEGPRANTTPDSLAALRPAFAADGTVTAGNASPLSDGAAAVSLVSDNHAKSLGTASGFRIVSHAVHAAAPADIFIAPVGAIEQTLKKAKRNSADIDLFELNEAFAAQTLACQRALRIPPDRLNVCGGAIALGHPLGCSGTRVLVTLMHALERLDKQSGIASLCLGGGEAVAMLIERAY